MESFLFRPKTAHEPRTVGWAKRSVPNTWRDRWARLAPWPKRRRWVHGEQQTALRGSAQQRLRPRLVGTRAISRAAIAQWAALCRTAQHVETPASRVAFRAMDQGHSILLGAKRHAGNRLPFNHEAGHRLRPFMLQTRLIEKSHGDDLQMEEDLGGLPVLFTATGDSRSSGTRCGKG